MQPKIKSAGKPLERLFADLGDKVPANEKLRGEQLIEEARKALAEEDVPRERYRQLAGDLQAMIHMISSAAYQQTDGPGGAPGPERQTPGQGQAPQAEEEEVIDAEYSEQ